MFGDLSGMMDKLKEAQVKIEETKARLNTVLVGGESGNGKVKVTVTANREVRSINITDDLFKKEYKKITEKSSNINIQSAKHDKEKIENEIKDITEKLEHYKQCIRQSK